MTFAANSSWTRIVPVLASVVFFPLFGAELYVSPKGNARGDGSREAPWSLERAFTGTGINPGDTLYLLGGTYFAASKDYYYRSYIKGEADKPVTVRPFGNERVVIDGGIDGDRLRRGRPEAVKERGDDGLLGIDAIADTYWHLHRQARSAWAQEIDLRPFKETF